MGHPRFSGEEICRRGQEWYKTTIQPQIDEQANRGKPLIIDIETGEYEIGDDSLTVTKRMLVRKPQAALYGVRVGYPTMAKAGGGWGLNKP